MGLNTKQINELSIGIKLAIELAASQLNLRKFLTIQSNVYGDSFDFIIQVSS